MAILRARRHRLIAALAEMAADPDPEKSGRVMEAILQMNKLDLARLKRAYAG